MGKPVAMEESSGSESDSDGYSGSDDNMSEPISGKEMCTFDVRNLLAMNSHQVDDVALHRKVKGVNVKDDDLTIGAGADRKANEAYILTLANEGCSQLLASLWKLETERTDAGPIASLPSYYTVPTPREMPPPTLDVDTKWEKFAKERGITKEKRSRKVWDEEGNNWTHLTGYEKKVRDKEWPIMEVNDTDDPYDDPWQVARDAKKTRVEKNIENRMRNAERSGELSRGSTNRAVKGKKSLREKGRDGFEKQIPAGVPVDLKDGNQRGKASTMTALHASQRSTASLGIFDKMREGEPKKKAMASFKKRKFESGTDRKVVKSEAAKGMKVLESVISGGGKQKERDISKGKYSRGETGYDFDYDDGTGSSFHKKKKGRAGMGKMKKMTKKRAK